MKRQTKRPYNTRKWLEAQLSKRPALSRTALAALRELRDALDSNARLRDEARDLKARLKAARESWFGDSFESEDEFLSEPWERQLWNATDLSNKNWRK